MDRRYLQAPLESSITPTRIIFVGYRATADREGKKGSRKGAREGEDGGGGPTDYHDPPKVLPAIAKLPGNGIPVYWLLLEIKEARVTGPPA
ncbi:hypothetical protein KM043_013028 [Ampulex compressa]|nr:hypothetical protein KM043_013028 [Ampulex compressa]